VNDAPTFSPGPDHSVLEDAGAQTVPGWATGISPGPPDETSQAVTFSVSTDNAGLFTGQPAVAANGTLTYEPADDANGQATVTVTARDDGGTANGGKDESAPRTFTITVGAVDDAPSFSPGGDQTVLEDAGAQTVPGWATAVSAGPPNESGQTVTFVVASNNASLFAVQPAVDSTGKLSYKPAANANGLATVTVSARDDGGTANGGIDASPPKSFTITVGAVNDPPTFTAGGDQTVVSLTGAQTVPGWATSIQPGPSDEAAQSVGFIVTNDNPGLFAAQPAVSANGTLTFTPTLLAIGAATVTVRAVDNGGTANGGADTSAPRTFVISII
jgi:hypothetical protein